MRLQEDIGCKEGRKMTNTARLWIRRVGLFPIVLLAIVLGVPVCALTVGIDDPDATKSMLQELFHEWWWGH